MKNVFFQRTSENTVFWNFGKNQLSISIMKPELSIITATYNAEATLPRTLKSVESQTFGWNIQHNFLMNLISAMGAYCFFDNKPTAIRGFYLEHSKQLSIWE